MISVVTITYNNYEELIDTLNSIQGITNIESVVINGGSCEKTKNFLMSYSGKVISEKDNGIADAFNKGIKYSSGDFIVFLNSGDILSDKNYYTKCSKLFKNDSTIDFIYSDIIFKDSLIGDTIFRKNFSNLGKGIPFYHQTLVMKKEIFLKIGNFNELYKIAMDYDLMVRMIKHKYRGHYLQEPSIEMDGTGISSNIEDRSIAECFHSLKSHKMLNLQNFYGIAHRYCKYLLRKIILKIFGTKFLTLSKKIKRIIFH